jgi:ribose transport system permease protein
MTATARRLLARLLSSNGMLVVLLLLCALLSAITWREQQPTDPAAARALAATIQQRFGNRPTVLTVVRDTEEDRLFSQVLQTQLEAAGAVVVASVHGQPADARRVITKLVSDKQKLDVIACNAVTSQWSVFDNLGERYPTLSETQVMTPESYWWPDFLKMDNLLNIANQIAVIAILAVGATLVIITGGIDLSVGSLIALSAVLTTLLIRDYAGAEAASTFGVTACCLAAMALCGLIGAFSGFLVMQCRVPPFIVTLSMMLVASGLAYIISDGQSISQVPEEFVWLGRGADLFGIPNAVVLMLLLYLLAHILMTRMALGRYIYAIGGNAEAARLSGVPIRRVLLLVYALCGLLAGLGGVVMASQLKSGAPTYGQMYELYVIAAVVVGGASLTGGEGKIFGTLVGAFIIAVIQNGMNLVGLESNRQKVVLGLVILGAVLLDRLRKKA